MGILGYPSPANYLKFCFFPFDNRKVLSGSYQGFSILYLFLLLIIFVHINSVKGVFWGWLIGGEITLSSLILVLKLIGNISDGIISIVL